MALIRITETGFTADIDVKVVLLDKARFDYDAIARLHSAYEIRKLVVVTILPAPLRDKPRYFIAIVAPVRAHEPI